MRIEPAAFRAMALLVQMDKGRGLVLDQEYPPGGYLDGRTIGLDGLGSGAHLVSQAGLSNMASVPFHKSDGLHLYSCMGRDAQQSGLFARPRC